MRFLTLAILSIVALTIGFWPDAEFAVFPRQLEQPSPRPGESGNKPQTEPQHGDNHPNGQGTPHDQSRSAENQKRREQESSPDWWLSGGLILVGLLQLIVFGEQARQLRKSIDLTRLIAERQEKDMAASIGEAARAATAMERVARGIADSVVNAQQMAETQRQFGKAQMRPYIALVDPGFIPQDNKRPYFAEIQLNMVNTGHTPAHNVRFYARFDVLPFPIPEDFDFSVPANGLATGGLINPGQRLYFRRNMERLLPDNQYTEIMRGRRAEIMCLYGTVFFDDIFGEEHRTNFCSFGVWDTTGRFSTRNTPQHNDAT